MKSWIKSKTIWANVLAIVIVIALQFGIQPDQPTMEKTGEVMAIVMPLVNILLRFVTKKPIVNSPNE
jgi:hypothetical protein